MKTYIFDLDGTIITNGQPIHNVIAEKIKQLCSSGSVIFASARPIRDMLPLLPHELHNCLMIGCNGGMAWQNGNFLFSHGFNPEHFSRVITFLKEEKIPYVIDGVWYFSVSEINHEFHNYMRKLSIYEKEEKELLSEKITKILVLDGESRTKIDRFIEREGFKYNINHHKADNLFDITPQSENKYQSLCKLGVDFNNSIVFGNDENDYAMLDNAKVSVFIGATKDYPNANFYCRTEYIPSILDEVTDSF
ncbi:HAD family hydrolase [Xenorhabdus bovienii]|uniref:HAD-IIB family hydrolase n=1 Tax=Xenorhabdus bovienii TaxID=40576 RepID=UPI0023B33828|nr:HAD-IIB family hydrolase [Xenorhabdus bovienii]MDE9492049.1 HAD family hydrolase [Xenorhabdus bovienii]MDE9500442.1 HAD family hydrolase [Xenorhabdus bovienii]MDE9524233.1 HAD family hydrolase [Xenorhabdus bovienii]MDE9567484.1 HAD family hydrolase [Xenorhabdus bovienii]